MCRRAIREASYRCCGLRAFSDGMQLSQAIRLCQPVDSSAQIALNRRSLHYTPRIVVDLGDFGEPRVSSLTERRTRRPVRWCVAEKSGCAPVGRTIHFEIEDFSRDSSMLIAASTCSRIESGRETGS